MKLKSIKELNDLKGKKVFLRLDLNIPLLDKKIEDDYKIRAVLKTINFLLKKRAAIIIATHLGKPQGKTRPDLSVEPVAKHLQKLLARKIRFIPEVIGKKVSQLARELEPGEIMILENLRFKKGELENKPAFAKELAALANIYVNDALAVSHREQASVAGIKKYLPAYAGLLLEQEINALNKILKPRQPLITVMGGAKMNTKIPLIGKFYPISNYILLGGGLANTFLKFKGIEIGKSLYSQDGLAMIKKILKGRQKNRKIILPKDVTVKLKNGKIKAKKIGELLKSDTIFDIGPETISYYAEYIKKAQTIIWNGPMGKFEERDFRSGTMAVARLIASRSSGRAYGLAGGGETVAALRLSGMMEYMDWISTAGGAMLSYLGGERMPGLEKIIS
jgi:3-phosphoglycerate kinase